MSLHNDIIRSVVRVIEFDPGPGPVASFQLGSIVLGSVVFDGRIEPPWCVQMEPYANGGRYPEHRFQTQQEAKDYIWHALGF